MTSLEMLSLMIGWHALADYPLQGDFLARAKNVSAPIPGVPWYQALGAHSAIHGLGVGVITGIWWLGVAEAISHAAIDYAKCRGLIGFNIDQLGHFACKALWAAIAMAVTA